jgi:hypothetical protein
MQVLPLEQLQRERYKLQTQEYKYFMGGLSNLHDTALLFGMLPVLNPCGLLCFTTVDRMLHRMLHRMLLNAQETAGGYFDNNQAPKVWPHVASRGESYAS